jgi:Zn-finger nucleic acid-binding protein
MQPITYQGVEIERCRNCWGIWFDDFELEDLKTMAGSEIIDIGDIEVGKDHNENEVIFCPKCVPSMLMVSEHDQKQPHIKYERCPECNGVYFDAGEFRDLKELTVKELFRSFFNKKQTD